MKGRPKLYHEKRTSILVTIEDNHLKKLEDTATDKGITRNELINALLKNADSEEALALAEALGQLRKQVQSLETANKELFDSYRKDINKAEAKIMTSNYDDLIEPDEQVIRSFSKVKSKIDKTISSRFYDAKDKGLPVETFDYWSDVIIKNLKDDMLKAGKVIKDEKKSRLMIRNVLLKNYAQDI